MESKQEIGKFFREQLDKIDNTPNEKLWQSIDQDLNQKKRKRLLFWFLPITAVLGSIIFMVLKAENKVEIPAHQIKITKNVVLEAKKDTLKPNFLTKDSKQLQNNSNKIVSTNEQKITKNAGFSTTKKSTNALKLVQNSKRLVRSTATHDEYEITKKYRYSIAKNQSKNKFAVSQKSKKTWVKKSKKSKKNLQQKQLANGRLEISTDQKHEDLISNSSLSKLDLVANNPQNIEKQNLESEVEIKMANSKTGIDSLSTNKKILQTEIKKPLKTAKKDDRTKVNNDKKLKKIYLFVTPFVGATKFRPTQSVNPFSDQYNAISTTGNVSSNYGVYLRAMFFEKLGVRIGVGKQNVGYETTISRNQNSLFDFRNIDLQITTTEEMLANKFVNENEITYLQKTSYNNFPAQIYFVFKENKFGFATAAGLDFMILGDNTLSVKSNSVSEFTLGAAKHLEKVSYAATLDLIFSYKLTKDFNFELCPNLKYQFKGYNRTNNFEPLILSLQTGFSYKF